MDLIVSEFVRADLNTSGVYQAGQTNTEFIIANKQGFAYGSRKMLTLKRDEIISTDQTEVVATIRMDFEKLFATTTPVCWVGYDVTAGVA